MKTVFKLSLAIAISSLIQASDEIANLAESKCGGCHLVNIITKEKLNNMSAPPIWAVTKKVRTAYPDRGEQVQFIVDFSLNPSEDKMLFPKETKKLFGVMPSQKGLVSKEDLKDIAEFILDK